MKMCEIFFMNFLLIFTLLYFSDVLLKYEHGLEQERNIQEAGEHFANSYIDLSEEIS